MPLPVFVGPMLLHAAMQFAKSDAGKRLGAAIAERSREYLFRPETQVRLVKVGLEVAGAAGGRTGVPGAGKVARTAAQLAVGEDGTLKPAVKDWLTGRSRGGR